MATAKTVNHSEAWLKRLLSEQENAVRAAAHEIAKHLETYAKQHHAWKPDTHLTDRTTQGEVKETEEVVWVILSSDSPWSKYLELARDGRWAWLRPAVLNNLDTIRAILAKHLKGATITPVSFESTAEFRR